MSWGSGIPLCGVLVRDLPEYVQSVVLDRSRTTMSIDRVSALNNDICGVINWSLAPEGYEFWSDLYNTGDTTAFDHNFKCDKFVPPTWQEKFIDKFMLGEVYWHPSGINYIFRATEMSVQRDFVQIHCSLIQVLKGDFYGESIFMITKNEANKISKASNRDKDWLERCETAGRYVPKDYGATAGIHGSTHMHRLSDHGRALDREMERHRQLMMMGMSPTIDIPSRYRFGMDMDMIGGTKQDLKVETLDDLLGPDKKKETIKKQDEFKLQSHKKLDIF